MSAGLIFYLAFGPDKIGEIVRWCRENGIESGVRVRSEAYGVERHPTLPVGAVKYCIEHNISHIKILQLAIMSMRERFLEVDTTLSVRPIETTNVGELVRLYMLYHEVGKESAKADLSDFAETYNRAGQSCQTKVDDSWMYY